VGVFKQRTRPASNIRQHPRCLHNNQCNHTPRSKGSTCILLSEDWILPWFRPPKKACKIFGHVINRFKPQSLRYGIRPACSRLNDKSTCRRFCQLFAAPVMWTQRLGSLVIDRCISLASIFTLGKNAPPHSNTDPTSAHRPRTQEY